VGEIKKPLYEMLIVNTLGDDAQLYEAGLQQDDAAGPNVGDPLYLSLGCRQWQIRSSSSASSTGF
jgi:hypothetical protein